MIAVIAGKGNLAQEACKSLLEQKQAFFVISLFPEDNANKIQNVIQTNAQLFKKEFYKLGEILKLLKSKKTEKVFFIGKVDKSNLLKKIKFDWLAIKMLANLVCKSDKNIMEALLSELKKHNIKVLKQTDILKSLFVSPGVLTGKLTNNIKENIDFGLNAAKNISLCDIGQTVVVKDKMIIAIEAIEGTDSCIARGIQLGKKDIVICKTAHQNQNKKYDYPTLGPDSLNQIQPGQVKVIAWQSDKTFIANKEEFVSLAKKLGITLVSV